MVEGDRDADAIALGVTQGQAGEVAVIEDVVVGQRRSLRESGGAGGVLDVDGIIALQGRLALGEPGGGHLLPRGEEGVPVGFQQQRAAQVGAARPDGLEHRGVVELAKAAGVDEDAHAGLAQGVFQLAGQVGGVDVDENGADAGGGVLHHHPLVAVGGPDADAVAGGHPQGEEGAGGAGGQVPQLVVGGAEALVEDHEGLAAAVALDRRAQVIADGLAEQGCRAGAVGVGEGRGMRCAVHGILRFETLERRTLADGRHDAKARPTRQDGAKSGPLPRRCQPVCSRGHGLLPQVLLLPCRQRGEQSCAAAGGAEWIKFLHESGRNKSWRFRWRRRMGNGRALYQMLWPLSGSFFP